LCGRALSIPHSVRKREREREREREIEREGGRENVSFGSLKSEKNCLRVKSGKCVGF
jgi:hypothetical protein